MTNNSPAHKEGDHRNKHAHLLMTTRTIVCDGNENAPGKSYGDEFLVANIYDPYEIKNVISEYSKKKNFCVPRKSSFWVPK